MAQIACMNLALELRPTYGSMVWEYVNLGTIFADAPIEIRALAQEDRLQMLKRLEAQATQDAVVSESPVCEILRMSGRCLSRPMSEPTPKKDSSVSCTTSICYLSCTEMNKQQAKV